VRERVKITIWPQCDLIALTLSITHCVGSKVSQLSTAPPYLYLAEMISFFRLHPSPYHQVRE
jgi:hypothetical protein